MTLLSWHRISMDGWSIPNLGEFIGFLNPVGEPLLLKFPFLLLASWLPGETSPPNNNVADAMMSPGSAVIMLVMSHRDTLVWGQNSMVWVQIYHRIFSSNQSVQCTVTNVMMSLPCAITTSVMSLFGAEPFPDGSLPPLPPRKSYGAGNHRTLSDFFPLRDLLLPGRELIWFQRFVGERKLSQSSHPALSLSAIWGS